MEPTVWVSDAERLGSIALSSVVLYLGLVALIRVIGKRATAQMNSFDWIVTVAVGSLLASGILSASVGILDAGLAIVTLGLCQWALTRLSVRLPAVEKAVKPQPRLLVHRGAYLEAAMADERVTRAEVDAALRGQGYTSVREVGWAVLETDASISVIPADAARPADCDLMQGVNHPAAAPGGEGGRDGGGSAAREPG